VTSNDNNKTILIPQFSLPNFTLKQLKTSQNVELKILIPAYAITIQLQVLPQIASNTLKVVSELSLTE